MIHEVLVPDLGADEVYVVAWLVSVGDQVKEGDPLVEVMTDKANVDIPATTSGTLVEQLAADEARLTTGSPVARIESDG